MKCIATLWLLIIVAGGCNSPGLQTKLVAEQQVLKDSAHHISGRIGDYLRNGYDDSAAAEKLHLAAVYTRLIAIQASLDSLAALR